MNQKILLLEDRRFYVYVYLDYRFNGRYVCNLNNGATYCLPYMPFYFGKGCGSRIYDHLNENYKPHCNPFKIKRIKELQEFMNPFVVKIRKYLTEDEAYDLENELINCWGTEYDDSGYLTNIIKKKGKAYNRVYHRPWNKGMKKEDSLKMQKSIEKMKITKKIRNHPSPMKGRKHPNPTKLFKEENHRWVEIDINKFIDLFFENINNQKIGEKLNCSRSPINRIINSLNFPTGNRRVKNEYLRKQDFIYEFRNNKSFFYVKNKENKNDFYFRIRNFMVGWNKKYDHERRVEYKNKDFDIE